MPEQLDVYKAYSGKEALAWMERTRIDIILTDISMPGITGLELVEQVQELWPRCKVIFLTGYDHFDYVYQAIQMNDVHYLLKTEGYDKVIETVEGLVDELKNDAFENQELILTAEEKYAYDLMEQSNFMRHVLQNSKTACKDQERLAKELEHLGLPLDSSKPVYLILGHWAYPKNKSYLERSRLLNYVRASWNRRFSKHIISSSIVDRYGDVVWFIQAQEDKEMSTERLVDYLEGTLEVIQEDCQSTLELNVQFTMSNTLVDWPLMTEKYGHLRQLQQLSSDQSFPQIIKETEQDTIASAQGINSTLKMDILRAQLDKNDKDGFFEDFTDIRKTVEAGTYQEMLAFYFAVALVLFVDIDQNELGDQIENNSKLLSIEDHATLNDGFEYLEQVAKQLFTLKKTKDQDRSTKVIDRMSHYIEHHLHEDLSLVRLSEIYYFNPSYLSHLFKQEQGVNLSEFIDQARINRAKKLLRETELKVRDVSEQIGYNSAHSFSRFFKKMTGMTPKEYRDTL